MVHMRVSGGNNGCSNPIFAFQREELRVTKNMEADGRLALEGDGWRPVEPMDQKNGRICVI